MKNPVYVLLAVMATLAVALLAILAVLAGVTGDPKLLALVVDDIQQGLQYVVAAAGPLVAVVTHMHNKKADQADPGGNSAPQSQPPTGETP